MNTDSWIAVPEYWSLDMKRKYNTTAMLECGRYWLSLKSDFLIRWNCEKGFASK